MSAVRAQELRQVLGFVRSARARLREGRPADAIRYHLYAVNALAYIRGAQATRPDAVRAVGCSATLWRVVAELGAAIEATVRAAVAPAQADPADLIELVAQGIDVLRTRDGVEMDVEAPAERARNIVSSLLGHFEISPLPETDAGTQRVCKLVPHETKR